MPTPKDRIVASASLLAASAPTHELREFYTAMRDEFARQLAFDIKRAEADAKLAAHPPTHPPVTARTKTRDDDK